MPSTFDYKNGLPQCNESGVYSIRNTVNGKRYVGSSVGLTFRLYQHRNDLRKGKHENQILQRAWDKHGESKFRFLILEVCSTDVYIEREQYWIDKFRSAERETGYNIARFAGAGPMLGRNHTPEARAEMSEKRKGIVPVAATAAAALANKGRPMPEKTRKALSDATKGKPLSAEHRAAVKANHWSKREDAAEIAEKSAAKQRGKKHSEEHNAKIGNSHWKNRPDAEEIRAKVAASTSASKKGKTHNTESKANMSNGQKRRRQRERAERVAAAQETIVTNDPSLFE